MEMFLSMKMEHWSECLDRYLEGMFIGLGIAIFITICTAVTDLYYLDKQSSRKDYKRLRGGQSETKDSTHHVSIHSNVWSVLPCQYYAE